METETTLTRGQLAKRAGVGPEALRFYEIRGLIPKPRRDRAGYRRYPEETAQRLRFIAHAKTLGFSLREIHELLKLRDITGETCGDVNDRISARLAEVERKLRTLESLKACLEKLAEACDGRRPIERCPIMQFIEQMESFEQDCPALIQESSTKRNTKRTIPKKAAKT